MPQRVPRVAEYLLKAKVIDEFQMKSLLAHQAQWGHRLTRVINDMRIASEPKVVEALAQAMRLQAVDLAKIPGDAAALKKLDAAFCADKGVFPCALKDQGKTLFLAMCDPTDFATTDEVEKRTRCRLKLLVTGETALSKAIERCYRDHRPATGVAHAQASVGIELAPAVTGEFMDAKGEVVGAMRNIAESRKPAPPTMQSAPPPPPIADPSALFDFMPEALTPEEKQRLEAVKANHERGSLILRAVLELCVEKGLLSADDVNKLKL